MALKDSYLIKLAEEEIQSLIQQDTSIYENLRELAVSPTDVVDTTVNMNEDDLALMMDSELAGINIDDLSTDDNMNFSSEVVEEKIDEDISEPADSSEKSIDVLNDIDEDILNALDDQPDFSNTKGEVDDTMGSLSDDDEAFFQNFGADMPMEDDNSQFSDPALTIQLRRKQKLLLHL